MTKLKCLTTKEVARLCRVSDATVKRWDDAELLQSERTQGGHRRFRAEEVIRFQREQQLGLKQNHGDESVRLAANRQHTTKKHTGSSFFHSLISGCEESVSNILITAHLDGTPLATIFDEVICPAMNLIGELWYKGEISVTQEHLATRVAQNAVYKLRGMLTVPQVNNELAMCCALEGDFHELPTHMVQITLENEGWEVMNFGANTPLYCLAEEVLRHSPKIVCISAAVLNNLERLSRDYKDFTEQIFKSKTSIVIGGCVFEEKPIRQRFPAEFYARSFGDIVGFTKGILPSV
ncbi:MAG: B12-binding domain-containing protein [Acidobacteriota bacterium]